MQGLAIWRATSAACAVRPPTAVTIPAETAKPATSAVLVSGRTRITGSPPAAIRSAVAESNAMRPTAIPADAPVPRAAGSWTSVSRWRASLSKSRPLSRRKRLRRRDQSLFDEVDREPQRGLRRALRRAGLQNPQFAVFDREFDVLHVGKFPFEPRQRFAQLRRDRRKRNGDRCLGFRGAAAGYDVFALRLRIRCRSPAAPRRSMDRARTQRPRPTSARDCRTPSPAR